MQLAKEQPRRVPTAPPHTTHCLHLPSTQQVLEGQGQFVSRPKLHLRSWRIDPSCLSGVCMRVLMCVSVHVHPCGLGSRNKEREVISENVNLPKKCSKCSKRCSCRQYLVPLYVEYVKEETGSKGPGDLWDLGYRGRARQVTRWCV